MTKRFFPDSLTSLDFSMTMGQRMFQIYRSWHCGHFGLCIFLRKSICVSQNLLRCWFVVVFNHFAKMDVKSYPLEESMLNLASWTSSNFGRYRKCPKWSSQSRRMTDFLRKGRIVKPHHASLFLSLSCGVVFLSLYKRIENRFKWIGQGWTKCREVIPNKFGRLSHIGHLILVSLLPFCFYLLER